jgi:hypothetical protein
VCGGWKSSSICLCSPMTKRTRWSALTRRPCQLIGHLQLPEPPQQGRLAREDTEFSRNGACSTFLMFEPQTGWRHALVKDTRTKRDFADCLKCLLDDKYASAPKVRLLLDNLNTHTPAALYEMFAFPEALRLAKRIEWHDTPFLESTGAICGCLMTYNFSSAHSASG